MIVDLSPRSGYLRDISPHKGNSLARKILLADDSVTAQNMGRKILSDAGYEVIAVNNGSAALKKIAELKPDLVILDVYMPGYSGLEVCQRLKESQETARIPVLLSVGKLEPFKPDEAQRVRADAFIVKPFEASELLSALSKLEDKIVPRSEPSKPGRFARAMAVAEESSRGNAKEAANDETNGWKNRIAFPHEKEAEPEEKVADEASFYNPMNRDLRTVVETPAEKAERVPAPPIATKAEAANPPAPAAAAVPVENVMPQEVAAIAAAVAHMRSGDVPAETRSDGMPGPSAAEKLSVETVAVEAAPVEAALVEAKSTVVDPAAVAESGPESKEKEKDSEGPATMAGGTESEVEVIRSDPRWSAVPVALDNVEASSSLEQEMRAAYAAYSAYQSEPAGEASSVATAPQAEPVSEHCPPPVSQPEPILTEGPVAAIATPEPGPVSHAGVREVPQVPAADQATTQSQEAAIVTNSPVLDEKPELLQAESAPSNSLTEIASPKGFSHLDQIPVSDAAAAPSLMAVQQPTPEPAVAEAVVAAANHEMPSPPDAPAGTDLISPAIESFSQAMPQMPVEMSAQSEAERQAERQAEPGAYSHPESEVVKSSAAAWATWRQIRDTSGAIAAAGNSHGIDTPQPSDSAAMAVAAGAEQIAQPVSVPATSDTPADVASIVDSVLADLRPRLMEEISRKMAQKK
jgi:CheY-like chemotaxis protein